MERKTAIRFVVEGPKERNTLNVVPMKVRNKNVRVHGVAVRLPLQMLSQRAKAGAAVKNISPLARPYFDARGISSIAEVLLLRSWSRASDAPELNQHRTHFVKLLFLASCSGTSVFVNFPQGSRAMSSKIQHARYNANSCCTLNTQPEYVP